MSVFISDFSVACALGPDNATVASNLFAAKPNVVRDSAELSSGRAVPVGRFAGELGGDAAQTRTNRIVAHCLAPLRDTIEQAKARYGADRVGVLVGTSTSGIGEGGEAMKVKLESGRWPASFSLGRQQLGDSARFAARRLGVEGPYYVVSTACTSGARAMAAGARLIGAGLCDVVVCGGVDSLCDLTLNGFAALDSLSDMPCNPMSANRNGLNLGEGGAFFVLTREPARFRLAGWGESVDGYHMSAPDPEGKGAEVAMRGALAMAGEDGAAIDFVHLHGTATPLNDQMEAGVVDRLLGCEVPCASTKPLTGHTLGAAGAVQAALCLMAMESGRLPPHVWDGARDPSLPPIRLAEAGETGTLKRVLSASYAFGGNNAALVLASE
jgi:3-oxoacyl-[acyl-carrier-protein] synthase-1